MSKETLTWLNENVLVGFTDKRGKAWHSREGYDNHYTGAIPVEDVHKRLFDWTADERPLFVSAGAEDAPKVQVEGRKAIVRSDNAHVMGVFKDGYQPHQYGEWLVSNVANILDDSLSIGSAGLLKGGAVAWVSVEVPETLVTEEGVAYRPHLLAATSFDGSVATTYKRVVTNTVCDNTMSAALRESSPTLKVRHSKNSQVRLAAARDALDIVHQTSVDFEEEVKRLCAIDVTERTWEKVLDALSPMPPEFYEEGAKRTRAVTMAETKREELSQLWATDPMVAPWSGSAFGVWQAVNTYQHHKAIVRNAGRAERNMLNAISGTTADNDNAAMNKVLAVL